MMTAQGENVELVEDIRDSFTKYRAVQAEGARIGLMVCRVCGAAICLDPGDTFDAVTLHYQWHLQLEDDSGSSVEQVQ